MNKKTVFSVSPKSLRKMAQLAENNSINVLPVVVNLGVATDCVKMRFGWLIARVNRLIIN